MTARLYEYITTIVIETSMIIQNVATSAGVLILLGPRRTGRIRGILRTAGQFLALLLVLIVCNGIWSVLFANGQSYYVTHFLLAMGYAAYLGKAKEKPCLIAIILFYSVEICLLTFSTTFPHVLMQTDLLTAKTIDAYVRNVIVLLTIPMALFFRKYETERFEELPNISIFYALSIGITTLGLTLIYQFSYEEMDIYGNLFALAAFFGVLVLNLMAYYLNYAMCLHSHSERQLLAENYIISSEKDMLQLSSQNMEEMRRLRHDMKNHCGYMELLLRENRYSELEEYFKQMQGDMQQPLSQIDCGNETISAILNLECAKAASREISLTCNVVVPPVLPFDKMGICSLLTNLIDNAIAACEALGREDARVEITIGQRHSQLYLSVENPVRDFTETPQRPSLHTTKQDKTLHGYGSKIVDDIVRKYNGQISRAVDHGKFIAVVMLDMRWQDAQPAV